MKKTWMQFRSFDRCIQLLLVNQFGINLGFYMLMPYLANHLSGGLGMAAWTVGLVLGVRTLSQQGMFLVGGMLADRLGYKPMIVAGCILRTVGFGLLGFVNDLPMLLVASVATGLAGALFNPAVRAYVAAEAGQRRVEAFALFNVFYQVGIFVGPLVGLLLLTVNFRTVCSVAAAIFLLLTVVQIRALPARSPHGDGHSTANRSGVGDDWRQVVGNRPFVWFAIAMVGSYVLSSQIYLALPLQAARVLGDAGNVGSSALFAVSALVAVLGQVRITGWIKKRWSSARALVVGLALMTASFLPLALTAGLNTPDGSMMLAVAALTPTLVTTVVLTMGTVVAYPFEMDTIVVLARDRLVATHYGLYNTFSGIGITVGNLATGAVWGLAQEWALPSLPWLALTATGVVCTAAIAILARSHRLQPPAPTAPLTPATTATHRDPSHDEQ
ncbi:putative ABC transport system membrane protein [Actinoplanes capillaceus]|uniref:ABC transport system membrane protein n=1 Tax=Actinoplanes campanulatus TaxID=113559 RepID=A0ABQ3WUH6_9ACTN|nr:MFS transporter [Actinoplanes capillaceus]GID49853.1 putative ABC transport system membrane protein [Actinoplanes capillaceus]